MYFISHIKLVEKSRHNVANFVILRLAFSASTGYDENHNGNVQYIEKKGAYSMCQDQWHI